MIDKDYYDIFSAALDWSLDQGLHIKQITLENDSTIKLLSINDRTFTLTFGLAIRMIDGQTYRGEQY